MFGSILPTTTNLIKQFRRDSSPLIIDWRSRRDVLAHDGGCQRYDTVKLMCDCADIEIRYQQSGRVGKRFVYSICEWHGLQRLGVLSPATRKTDELRQRGGVR